MARSLEELLVKRPADAEKVSAYEAQMRAEVRAFRLRELREAGAMTQVQMAEELSVSQKRVSMIERGDIERAQVDTLRRYAQALGGTLRVDIVIGDETYHVA